MEDSSYYIYILISLTSDKYYVGYSTDPFRRVIEHNNKPFNTYTSKYRPWELKAVFQCGLNEIDAIQTERFIKKQKSRNLLKQLCEPGFIPSGFLARLISPASAGLIRRVPLKSNSENNRAYPLIFITY